MSCIYEIFLKFHDFLSRLVAREATRIMPFSLLIITPLFTCGKRENTWAIQLWICF